MKFITEDDLRDLYKIEPFTDYDLEAGTRLTPGARQFLADRGIHMFDDDACKNKNAAAEKRQTGACVLKNKKLMSRMRSMDAMFLLTAEELLSRDVCLSQSVVNLAKQFAALGKAAQGEIQAENLACQACTGINDENFSDDLGDCFDITEFHMQLEKGREILILNSLRCALREIEPLVLELYEGRYIDEPVCSDLIAKTNQIINAISQMICLAFGGKKCQRQN